MILTDYYSFEKSSSKAKMRLDCIASTHSYPEFENRASIKAQRETDKKDAIKEGDILIYYHNVPAQFGGNVHRKADKSISIRGENLSSIYVPDITKPLGFGDFKNTMDALLFIFKNFKVINGVVQQGSIIEIFVARGKSKDRGALFELFSDGGLDEEINELRKRATPL